MKALSAVALAMAMLSMRAEAASQIQLEAPGPQGSLKATLLTPDTVNDQRAPVVLIIPGSGPTDRDGNNPLGVKAASYRLLAESLAQRGVRSVRIDKRGMFASAAAIPDANKVTVQDYADDVHAWIDVIKSKTGASCVWVLGHSEGGLVALAAAQRPEGLCGLILVSTAGRPLGAILREQLQANPANAPLLGDAGQAIAALERGERSDVSTMHPALQRLFAPTVQGFLISTMRLDPVALIRAYQGPVWVLQGDKDLQVGVGDAQRLGQAGTRARVVILEGVNHVLKSVAGTSRAANLATYADPDLPIAPSVADAVSAAVQGPARP
jgi:pimeloyl-ACP methyl ester carboxylesterase